MSLHPLISVDELAALGDGVQLYDLRWDLTDPGKGRAVYERGHIPGAVFADLDAQLAAPPGERGRHPLPDPAEFGSTLGALGISTDSHVVVYDDVGGRVAARLWWMLRSIGHEKAQVLDGGYQAWVDSRRDIELGLVTPRASEYTRPVAFTGVIGLEELEGRLLVDARAPQRYRGETEPVDPKPGHIPGAINIPSEANLGATGRFIPPAALLELYSGVVDDAVVYCGSGVTACHDALAMVVAGREMPTVYVGSYSEWSRADRPVKTGPEA